jgi:hypothetical protein
LSKEARSETSCSTETASAPNTTTVEAYKELTAFALLGIGFIMMQKWVLGTLNSKLNTIAKELHELNASVRHICRHEDRS